MTTLRGASSEATDSTYCLTDGKCLELCRAAERQTAAGQRDQEGEHQEAAYAVPCVRHQTPDAGEKQQPKPIKCQ